MHCDVFKLKPATDLDQNLTKMHPEKRNRYNIKHNITQTQHNASWQ